jgi:hypothetical protein
MPEKILLPLSENRAPPEAMSLEETRLLMASSSETLFELTNSTDLRMA